MKLPIKPDRGGLKFQFKTDSLIRILQQATNADEVEFDMRLFEAARWVNEGRSSFKFSDPTEADFEKWSRHPDRKAIEEWLRAKSAANDVDIIFLVSANVISEWHSIPARTLTQHRKMFRDIEEAAKKLAELLENTDERYYRGGGHGLAGAQLHELFTDKEADEIHDVVQAWNESHPVDFFEGGAPVIKPASSCFPTVEAILNRLASAARRLHDAGPIHTQPNKRGAMNGYFIRRMDELLRIRYSTYPADVLAAIATIALDVTIDADLVQKTVALPERSTRKKA